MWIDDNVQIVCSPCESEIINMVKNKRGGIHDSKNEESIATKEFINSKDKTILGLELKNFISQKKLLKNEENIATKKFINSIDKTMLGLEFKNFISQK